MTEWVFDAAGTPIKGAANSSNAIAIRVLVISNTEKLARAEELRPQFHALYTKRFATITKPPVSAETLVMRAFTPPHKTESADDSDAERAQLDANQFVFLAYMVGGADSDRNDNNTIVGLTRVFQEPRFNAVHSVALIVDMSLPASQQEALQRALFHATKTIGETMARAILMERRATAELLSHPNNNSNTKDDDDINTTIPTTQDFYRSLFLSTAFEQSLLTADGFVDRPDRLELTKWLDPTTQADDPVAFPDDVDVQSLDLHDTTAVRQYYNVLSLAFGGAPPSFAEWKIHYGQQPRLAPEWSFYATNKSDGTVLAAIGVERVEVDGAGGGGDDDMGERHVVSQDDKDDDALVFAPDFAATKAHIVATATTAYVWSVATAPASRNRGLASTLLRHAFDVAKRDAPMLQAMTIGVEIANRAAVRAYERAGMVVTKRKASGYSVVKEVALMEGEKLPLL